MGKHFIQAERGAKVQLYIPSREVEGRILPEVLLPRYHYYPDEMGQEKWQLHGWFVNRGTEGATKFIQRPVIELDDEHWATCMADPNFQSMMKKKCYTVHDALPARFRNQGEDNRLRVEKYAAALKAAGIPLPSLDEELSDEAFEVLTGPDPPGEVKTA